MATNPGSLEYAEGSDCEEIDCVTRGNDERISRLSASLCRNHARDAKAGACGACKAQPWGRRSPVSSERKSAYSWLVFVEGAQKSDKTGKFSVQPLIAR